MTDDLKWIKFFSNWWSNKKRTALRPRDKRTGRAKPCCPTCLHVDALAYAGGHDTRGVITLDVALDLLYGTNDFIAKLVEVGLWEPTMPDTWVIHDYDEVQAKPAELSAKRARAGRKGNCTKHHPPGCRCWETEPNEGTA